MSVASRPMARSASWRGSPVAWRMRPAGAQGAKSRPNPHRASSSSRAARPTPRPRWAKAMLQLVARAWSRPARGPAGELHHTVPRPMRSAPRHSRRLRNASGSMPARRAAAAVTTLEMDAGSRRSSKAGVPPLSRVSESLTAASTPPVRASRRTMLPRALSRAPLATRDSSRSRVRRTPAAGLVVAAASRTAPGTRSASTSSSRTSRRSPSRVPRRRPTRSRTTVVAPEARRSSTARISRPRPRPSKAAGSWATRSAARASWPASSSRAARKRPASRSPRARSAVATA